MTCQLPYRSSHAYAAVIAGPTFGCSLSFGIFILLAEPIIASISLFLNTCGATVRQLASFFFVLEYSCLPTF